MHSWRRTAVRSAAALMAAVIATAAAAAIAQPRADAAGAAAASRAVSGSGTLEAVPTGKANIHDMQRSRIELQATNAQLTEGTRAVQAPRDTVVLTVRASRTAAYEAREELTSRGLRQALAEAAERSAEAPRVHVRAERMDSFVAWPGTNGQFAVDEDGSVVDVAAGVRLRTPDRWRRELSAVREKLRAQYYGAMLPWSEVSAAVPRMAKFDVVDVETGLTFRAQRRAGSSHADVQPLTKRDSATMKSIYGGSWSWDRRPVLLRYDGRLFAASMNGMPHGGDGIPGNGFNGHFCIHFLGSTTHGKGNVDLAHQAMIHKAAGRLSSFLSSLNPYQTADLFVIAYNQQDRQLLEALTVDGDALAEITDSLHKRHVKLLRRNEPLPDDAGAQRSETDDPSIAWSMDVLVYVEGSSRGRGSSLTFDLVRSPSEGWQIRSASL